MNDISRQLRNEFIRRIWQEYSDKRPRLRQELMDIFGLTRGGLWFILNGKEKKRLTRSR